MRRPSKRSNTRTKCPRNGDGHHAPTKKNKCGASESINVTQRVVICDVNRRSLNRAMSRELQTGRHTQRGVELLLVWSKLWVSEGRTTSPSTASHNSSPMHLSTGCQSRGESAARPRRHSHCATRVRPVVHSAESDPIGTILTHFATQRGESLKSEAPTH